MDFFESAYIPQIINIGFLKNINDEQIKGIVGILKEFDFPRKGFTESGIPAEISKRLNIEESVDLIKLMFGLYSIVRVADDFEEVKTVAEQICKLSEAEEEGKKIFLNLINSLDYLDNYYEENRLNNYRRRGNFYFRFLSHSCDLRGRFNKDYSYKATPIEQYEPELKDLTTMVSLRFDISDGNETKAFSFQADAEQLDRIISRLLAAQKELRKLIEYTEKNKK